MAHTNLEVCMNVFNDREQPHWGEMYGSSSLLNARWSGTNATASGKRFQCSQSCSYFFGFSRFDGAV